MGRIHPLDSGSVLGIERGAARTLTSSTGMLDCADECDGRAEVYAAQCDGSQILP